MDDIDGSFVSRSAGRARFATPSTRRIPRNRALYPSDGESWNDNGVDGINRLDPTKSTQIDEKVRVVRQVTRSWRGMNGQSQSRDFPDTPDEASKVIGVETPSVIINRELNERGDTTRRTIMVQFWPYAGYLAFSRIFLPRMNFEGMGYLFVEPFVDLFFRQQTLKETLLSSTVEENSETSLTDKYNKEITECLLHYLDHDAIDIGETFKSMTSATPQTIINYNNLWMIYPPGSLIFSFLPGAEPVCYMVDSVAFEKPKADALSGPLALHC